MKRVTLVAASRHSRTVSTGGTACHSSPFARNDSTEPQPSGPRTPSRGHGPSAIEHTWKRIGPERCDESPRPC